MWDNLTISGFHFDSAAEYADAKREAETIEHICARMDVKNPDIALKVYYKLLDRGSFHTIVGMCFLKSLRDTIVNANIVDEEELKTIHSPLLVKNDNSTEFGDETALEHANVASEYAASVEDQLPPEETEAEDADPDVVKKLNRDLSKVSAKERKATDLVAYLRVKIKKLYMAIIALVIVIGILFAMAVHNNNLTFVNEEMAVQDKYSAWEEQLTEREKAVAEREKALENAE